MATKSSTCSRQIRNESAEAGVAGYSRGRGARMRCGPCRVWSGQLTGGMYQALTAALVFLPLRRSVR